jgi:hypothetical protein
MKKFRILATRDASESRVLVVPAESTEEAYEKLHEEGLDAGIEKYATTEWALDEGNYQRPYLGDPEGFEEVPEARCECGHLVSEHKEIEPGYAPCSSQFGCNCDDFNEATNE